MIPDRLAALDWQNISSSLDEDGWAVIPGLLDESECQFLSALYLNEAGFRSRVIMARHGFGRGEYRYFSYPLPPLVATLREKIYPFLVPTANRWMQHMGLTPRFPADHQAFLARCHVAAQARPTPLLLRYGPGDHNCLHQDLYGEHVFPIQLTVLLSCPGREFTGGEFVLTEQRPRMQSRVDVVPLRLGDGVLFAVNQRPKTGTRGSYRVTLRHGVSRIRTGLRHTLGVIFHDAT
ncbi:2OG-Fe(II) oxygenase [Gluconobacter sp. Dm-62]|uniref:2OG-Fe(II) oxygenase n=1 Tax=Gluconobacter sp. Dm-62 TaxID=2799804 RepID=UPI001B8D6FB9|nr:2OG-Fe(II) oxygenase [Gluconobacter sp. Dm-62]MBS1104022.1 2OG-Fe(II) oxygenase [Gluconobacter sp. Dm-62]